MASSAARRRLPVWALVVGFCGVGMVSPDLRLLPVIGPLDLTHIVLLVVAVFGFGSLLRVAGRPDRSVARTACRIILVYVLYQVLVVLPVALWLGADTPRLIVSTMSVRASWLLFPTMVVVSEDAQVRRLAGVLPVVAAVCVVVWGAYLAATGGGGYYVEMGELRYRILFGTAAILVAWPFVLALPGTASSRYKLALLVVALVGLMLANHRSGVVAFAVAGLVCLAMSGQARRIIPAMVPLTLVGVIVYTLWGRELSTAFGYTFLRLVDSGSPNAADRLSRWRLAGNLFVAHPFNDLVWSLRYYSGYLGNSLRFPHNFALEIAIQEGIAGLVFYGSILRIMLRGAWTRGRHDSEARALIGWLVAYTVFSLFNANHYLVLSMPLFVGALAVLAVCVDAPPDAGEPILERGGVPAAQV